MPNNLNSSNHISSRVDEELQNVLGNVLAMGGLAEEQLTNAIESLISSDVPLASAVVDKEIQVNTMEVRIDQECTNILARRQPAATDLRLLMAIIKTITDLERIGDEAQKIAKRAIDLTEKQGGPRSYYISIKAMGNLVVTMLHDALDALARMDSKDALAVANKEPESDDQYSAIMRQLITYMMEDARNISGALDAIWVIRALERIGDHSRNICEYVIYLVEGKDVRHISLEQVEKEVINSNK
ncbi:MAG: phosphate signaling complex protein PhoU [Pseudomonadota bacterium]